MFDGSMFQWKTNPSVCQTRKSIAYHAHSQPKHKFKVRVSFYSNILYFSAFLACEAVLYKSIVFNTQSHRSTLRREYNLNYINKNLLKQIGFLGVLSEKYYRQINLHFSNLFNLYGCLRGRSRFTYAALFSRFPL